jgi:hypothetical protein
MWPMENHEGSIPNKKKLWQVTLTILFEFSKIFLSRRRKLWQVTLTKKKTLAAQSDIVQQCSSL